MLVLKVKYLITMEIIEQETKLPISEVRLDGGNADNENNFIRHSKLVPGKNIRAIFVGPSGGGKTCALLSLIYNKEGITFKNIYLFSKSLFQPKYEELGLVMKGLPEIGFFTFDSCETVPSPGDISPYSIMIFDDIAAESNKNSSLRAYFSMGRHTITDTFFLSQTYSAVPKQLVRDNANVSIS